MVVSLPRIRSNDVRVASPGPRPGRPHLAAQLHPAAPFPAAPPRAGPDSSRTSSGSAVAARKLAGAPAGSCLSGAGSGQPRGPPWRRGLWDRDGRGDRDHLPRRRYRAAGTGRRRGPGAESAGWDLIPRWLQRPEAGRGAKMRVAGGDPLPRFLWVLEDNSPSLSEPAHLGSEGGHLGAKGLCPATVLGCGCCRLSCNLSINRCF